MVMMENGDDDVHDNEKEEDEIDDDGDDNIMWLTMMTMTGVLAGVFAAGRSSVCSWGRRTCRARSRP
jgi:hypothetical protein